MHVSFSESFYLMYIGLGMESHALFQVICEVHVSTCFH